MRMSVSVSMPVSVVGLLCVCVDRRGWQVDPRLASGRQRQRQRGWGAHRSSGAAGDAAGEWASGRVSE